MLQLTRERKTGNPVWRLQYQVSKIIQDEEEQKPNPVTQRVKIIMVRETPDDRNDSASRVTRLFGVLW